MVTLAGRQGPSLPPGDCLLQYAGVEQSSRPRLPSRRWATWRSASRLSEWRRRLTDTAIGWPRLMGGVFSFGDASFYGSMGNTALNKPIVGMAVFDPIAAPGACFDAVSGHYNPQGNPRIQIDNPAQLQAIGNGCASQVQLGGAMAKVGDGTAYNGDERQLYQDVCTSYPTTQLCTNGATS